MRAGIAPLTMLMLAAGSVLFSPTTRPRWRAGVLTLLLLGSVTPALEISRATLPGGSQWHGDGRNVAELTQRAWHYVGLLGPGWIKEVLRPPVPLPPDGTAPASTQVYKP